MSFHHFVAQHHIILLFNTNCNRQLEKTLACNQIITTKQASNKLASSGEATLVTDGMPHAVYKSGHHPSI